jgi:hypothetical protein
MTAKGERNTAPHQQLKQRTLVLSGSIHKIRTYFSELSPQTPVCDPDRHGHKVKKSRHVSGQVLAINR